MLAKHRNSLYTFKNVKVFSHWNSAAKLSQKGGECLSKIPTFIWLYTSITQDERWNVSKDKREPSPIKKKGEKQPYMTVTHKKFNDMFFSLSNSSWDSAPATPWPLEGYSGL